MPDRVEQEPDVAKIASQMAHEIWQNSGKQRPRIDDQEFFKLVSTCASALKGHYGTLDFNNRR